jgi:phosphoribosylformimino-5-aminoimidazole carboxamide ribotide isomerase
MQVWPAIDLRGGRCVRLEQGDYQRETVFAEDPVAVAHDWVGRGASCLHIVDLDGARDGQRANRDAVASIVEAVEVPCQLGGGIRDQETIEALLDLGLDRLVVGTRAVKQPDWFRSVCREYPGKLALGIDARHGWVATDGWRQTSRITAVEFARGLAQEPIAQIVYTDIARDGMMAGPNLDAMAEMGRAVPLPVVASGGVTTARDVQHLAQLGLDGCIIGRALYEGTLKLEDALRQARANQSAG